MVDVALHLALKNQCVTTAEFADEYRQNELNIHEIFCMLGDRKLIMVEANWAATGGVFMGLVENSPFMVLNASSMLGLANSEFDGLLAHMEKALARATDPLAAAILAPIYHDAIHQMLLDAANRLSPLGYLSGAELHRENSHVAQALDTVNLTLKNNLELQEWASKTLAAMHPIDIPS